MNWIDRLLMGALDLLWFRLLRKKARNPLYFIITNAVGDPFMVRYRLFRSRKLGIFVHHILRSDEDLELHDHPWRFTSFILSEGYVEVLPGDRARRMRAMDVVRHKATDAHRLILDRPAWTLVFVGPKERPLWGFHAREGWVPYNAFFDMKYGPGNWTNF